MEVTVYSRIRWPGHQTWPEVYALFVGALWLKALKPMNNYPSLGRWAQRTEAELAHDLEMPLPPVATCTAPSSSTGSLQKHALISGSPEKTPIQARKEGGVHNPNTGRLIYSFGFQQRCPVFNPVLQKVRGPCPEGPHPRDVEKSKRAELSEEASVREQVIWGDEEGDGNG